MRRFICLISVILPVLNSCCNEQHFSKADDYGRLQDGIRGYLMDLRDIQATGELNSVMVLKDGKILDEWYDVCYGPDFLNICWSMSKTFTATAVGFAVQDGLLSLDDKVVGFFDSDVLPETVSDTLAALSIRNLMVMSSGIKTDPIGPISSGKLENPTEVAFNAGFNFFPGERFRYNSLNTYLLGVIVSKVTGMSLEDYLGIKLFRPLGIQRYHWDKSAEGYNCAGWGLYLRTEDMAKMGQFFLQKGAWNGRQLLDEGWIEEAMKAQIYQDPSRAGENDFLAGYGYQMWCCTHNAARLDGAHGQFVVICPDKNAVIVITEHVKDTRKLFNSIWTNIYDAI